LLLVLGAFLAGLIVLGQWAQNQVRDQERYTVAFADIDCEAPPGLERSTFLDEVQYLASLPDRLRLLDKDLGENLARAFRRHPWVKDVAEVTVASPRQVHVRLVFRKPVLAVPLGTTLRAVDASGVLLPAQAATQGLPVFQGRAKPPIGPAGSRWGDPAVEARARSLQK
jgi:hypothetical protein